MLVKTHAQTTIQITDSHLYICITTLWSRVCQEPCLPISTKEGFPFVSDTFGVYMDVSRNQFYAGQWKTIRLNGIRLRMRNLTGFIIKVLTA
jgi:hypothetical protein